MTLIGEETRSVYFTAPANLAITGSVDYSFSHFITAVCTSFISSAP